MTEPASSDPPILIFVRDLMFSTRIVEASRAAGVPFKVIRKPEALPAEAGRFLIVDLNQEGAMDAAVAWKNASGGRAIGFVSHVDTEVIDRAKLAGVDRILSRGQFTQVLPNLVRE
ncbi:MAG: hypothetical protein H7Z14_18260 [Anaerolineae bacterium]|nr:hypothetical protein [Phycisphaerae bacterium]